MPDSSTILWGLLFGSIGMGYFVYGRKQRHAPAVVAGVLLMVLPYAVSSTWMMVLVSLALVALPFVWRP